MKNNFGLLIKRTREEGGLSLFAAARIVGCSKTQLWDLEQGRSANPTIQTLARLSAAFGIEIGKLARIAAYGERKQ
jgi:transcriptional regulator with XRE-family HTH domain